MDQIITSQNPYLDQIITSKNPNLDQITTSQPIYLYIYKNLVTKMSQVLRMRFYLLRPVLKAALCQALLDRRDAVAASIIGGCCPWVVDKICWGSPIASQPLAYCYLCHCGQTFTKTFYIIITRHSVYSYKKITRTSKMKCASEMFCK